MQIVNHQQRRLSFGVRLQELNERLFQTGALIGFLPQAAFLIQRFAQRSAWLRLAFGETKQSRSLAFFEAHLLYDLKNVGDTLLLGLLWRRNDGACAIACTQAEQQVAEGRLNLRKLQALKLRF